MSENLDRFQNAEPKPAIAVGFCVICLHDIQEGSKATCACGEITHEECQIKCVLCTFKGCSKCVTFHESTDDCICDTCCDKLIEERKIFVSNVEVLITTALIGLDYNISRPFRQETDKVTILEFITPGKPKIHVHIGKEITE